MNEAEARLILTQELSRYREKSYQELLALIDSCETVERISPPGTTYQIQMQVVFDDEPRKTLRVIGAIDDGGWRALLPLGDSFIMAPDGLFVGE
jgi:hypothetical protein